MSLIYIALVIIVAGVLLWVADKYIPMNAEVKRVLDIVVIICLVLWVLVQFGLHLPFHVPSLN